MWKKEEKGATVEFMVAPSFCLSYLALFPVVGGAHAEVVLNVAAEIAG